MAKSDNHADHRDTRRAAAESAEPDRETAGGDPPLSEDATSSSKSAPAAAKSGEGGTSSSDDADWGFGEQNSGISSETKIGLALVVLLVGVFAFVVWRKFDEREQLLTEVAPSEVDEHLGPSGDSAEPDPFAGDGQPPQASGRTDSGQRSSGRSDPGAQQQARADDPWGDTSGKAGWDDPAGDSGRVTRADASRQDPWQDDSGSDPSGTNDDWADDPAHEDDEFANVDHPQGDPFSDSAGGDPADTVQQAPADDVGEPRRLEDPVAKAPIRQTQAVEPDEEKPGVDDEWGQDEAPPASDGWDDDTPRQTAQQSPVSDPFGEHPIDARQQQSDFERPDTAQQQEADPFAPDDGFADEGVQSDPFGDGAYQQDGGTRSVEQRDDFGGDDGFAQDVSQGPGQRADDPFFEPDQTDPSQQDRGFGSGQEFETGMEDGGFSPDSTSGISVHEVRKGENYWTISKSAYGTALFYRALAEFNRHRISNPKRMRPGMKVLLPGADTLRQKYPGLTAGIRTPEQTASAAGTSGERRSAFFVSAEGRPQVRVGKNDTLSGIAQRHLGRASRWVQIYELNKGRIRDPKRLKVGTVLRLPQDASRVRLVRRAENVR